MYILLYILFFAFQINCQQIIITGFVIGINWFDNFAYYLN